MGIVKPVCMFANRFTVALGVTMFLIIVTFDPHAMEHLL